VWACGLSWLIKLNLLKFDAVTIVLEYKQNLSAQKKVGRTYMSNPKDSKTEPKKTPKSNKPSVFIGTKNGNFQAAFQKVEAGDSWLRSKANEPNAKIKVTKQGRRIDGLHHFALKVTPLL